MCGRFAFFSPREAVQEYFGIEIPFDLKPRYNVAPSQKIAVIREIEGSGTEAALLKWGLVPFWAKDPAIGHRMINARAETVAEKPAFRAAYKRRRCVILADGFYEWQAGPDGKQPHFITSAARTPLALAGLWEHWEKDDAPVIESCAIITTRANAALGPIHDRMPVILGPERARQWIAPDAATDALEPLLGPCADAEIESWPVSRAVNSPKNDGADLIKPDRPG